MPFNPNASFVPPPPEPLTMPESGPESEQSTPALSDWLTRQCAALGRDAGLCIRRWEQFRYRFLAGMYDSAKHGNCTSTPTPEDIAKALSLEVSAPDEASRSALQHWIGIIAAEAVTQIDSAKETVRINAEREAEQARKWVEEKRLKDERQALMERSEFDRLAVIAREAEQAKWDAYAAQQSEFAAYKVRTSATADASA